MSKNNEDNIEVQIVVTQLNDGELRVFAKSENPVSNLLLVGMLEAAKADILNKTDDSVELSLTQSDLDNDKAGVFKDKVAGDTIVVSAKVAELVLAARQ